MADLASIISGTDPMAPLALRAANQQANLAAVRDASQWKDQGPFGALARTIAGFRSSDGGADLVKQIVDQRSASNPELLQALAAPNAYEWGAKNPNASPLTLAGILANAPAAARAQLEGAQGGLAANNLAALRAAAAPVPGTSPTAPTGLAPTGVIPTSPRGPMIIPGTAPAPGPAAAPAPGPQASVPEGAGSLPDPASFANASAADRAAFIAKLPPQMRGAYIARLKGMAMPASPAGVPQ